ncbi:MAG: hypothetical protein WED87_05970, partial [Dehalococcoidia bacterium]
MNGASRDVWGAARSTRRYRLCRGEGEERWGFAGRLRVSPVDTEVDGYRRCRGEGEDCWRCA